PLQKNRGLAALGADESLCLGGGCRPRRGPSPACYRVARRQHISGSSSGGEQERTKRETRRQGTPPNAKGCRRRRVCHLAENIDHKGMTVKTDQDRVPYRSTNPKRNQTSGRNRLCVRCCRARYGIWVAMTQSMYETRCRSVIS